MKKTGLTAPIKTEDFTQRPVTASSPQASYKRSLSDFLASHTTHVKTTWKCNPIYLQDGLSWQTKTRHDKFHEGVTTVAMAFTTPRQELSAHTTTSFSETQVRIDGTAFDRIIQHNRNNKQMHKTSAKMPKKAQEKFSSTLDQRCDIRFRLLFKLAHQRCNGRDDCLSIGYVRVWGPQRPPVQTSVHWLYDSV